MSLVKWLVRWVQYRTRAELADDEHPKAIQVSLERILAGLESESLEERDEAAEQLRKLSMHGLSVEEGLFALVDEHFVARSGSIGVPFRRGVGMRRTRSCLLTTASLESTAPALAVKPPWARRVTAAARG